MKLLLDTHALLWMFAQPDRLGTRAANALADAHNALCLSAGSLWEISIKIGIGKLDLGENWTRRFSKRLTEAGIAILPIELDHCARVSTLPHHHRDPFDRLIVAQALTEDVPVVSRDRHLDRYGIKRLW
jgi:PIN domain nuclease of toxin-antitoxin system